MKLFGYFHMWPGSRELGFTGHNAGSETTVHACMRAMVRRGYDVTVIADQTPESYEIDGIQVLSPPKRPYIHDWAIKQAQGYDLILTHLDCSGRAMNLSLDTGIPLAHFVHNSMQLRFHNVIPHRAQLVIFNSHWVKEAEMLNGEPWPGKSIVLHPIVEPHHYRCERGEKITLVNPTPGKGADTFYSLSRVMPDYQFTTVKGCYGEQVAPPNIPADRYPNVEFIEHTPDIREVLRKTRVLLMPSDYESYGRIAIEAACAGIPTIAHPTPGLRESLGEAGIFCDRLDVPAWQAEIERLYSDDVYYRSRSNAVLKLAASLDPESEFDRLENALLKTVNDWQQNKESKIVNMWRSDRRIWETTEGNLVAEIDGRIPQNAIRLAVGIGGELSEDVARANGFLPTLETMSTVVEGEPESTVLNSKSLQPDEDKALHAPAENKRRGRPRKEVAA